MVQSDEFSFLLKKSGAFDELEIRILRSLINMYSKKQFKVTAALISKEAGISVTNAYKYLYSLQDKGLVEGSEDKNKLFWLARSSNPFPRLFSEVTKDYLDRRDTFSSLQSCYSKLVSHDTIWNGEKLNEQYDGRFIPRASFLFDVAKEEILITTNKFYDDIVLLEAIKRAVERGVKIRIIAQELHPELVSKLRKISIEMRLGRAWPYLIVVDGKHGLSVDGAERGFWFLNHNSSEYKNKFEDMWEKAAKF